MLRLRSVSNNSEERMSPKRKDLKSQQYQKRILPLHKENGMLKDRLHQMKFEVEDNLQTVIDNLDKDLQLKAKLINFQQLFELIKEQINKDHEKIECYQEQIERLQNNLELTAEQREEDFENYQQMNKILTEQIQQNKQQQHTLLKKQEEQVKILTHQNYQQEIEIEQLKKELHQELELTQQLQSKLQTVNDLEIKLKEQQNNYENKVQLLQKQIEQDNQVFKNELEIQQQKIEQKYKQMILDNKLMLEQIQEMKQNNNQIKQQKESMERTIENTNLKIKELKSEMISDKQKIAKTEKTNTELQKDLTFYKNKVEIQDKREIKYKEQLQQNEDQIQDLLVVKINFVNLEKTLMIKQQIEIEKLKQAQIVELKNLQNQIQIQKLKYEKLLGKKVDQKEVDQYLMIDFSQQYEDPVHIQYVQDLNNKIADQQIQIESLRNEIININNINIADREKLNIKFEQEKNQLITIQKQELQKQTSDFDQFKAKLQSDFNFKTQLLSQQFSFSLDQAKQEQKQLQQIIDQSKLSGDEKTKLLEIASEEIMKLRKKYDHDMYEERNNQKQIKHDHEGQILSIKQENQRQQDLLRKEIDNLFQQLKDLQNKEQFLRQKVEFMTNESKQDKQILNSQEILIGKKQNEIQKQNENIKGLNSRIKNLQLEVENAKQTYNIFAPAQSNSSYHQLKKIELEIPTDIININQRHSVTDLKLKPDLLEPAKKSTRNKSQQGQRQYHIKQQLMPYI